MRIVAHTCLALALTGCGAQPARDGGFSAFVDRGCYSADSCQRLVAEAEARFFRCGSHGVSCDRAKRDLDIARLHHQRFSRVEEANRCAWRRPSTRRKVETELDSNPPASAAQREVDRREATELTALITRHIGECASTGARGACDHLRRFIERWPDSPYRDEVKRQLEVGDKRWEASRPASPVQTHFPDRL